METRKAKTRMVAMVVLCGILVYALIATGGSLEPSAPPGPTMRNLNEIYDTVDSMARGGLTYPEKLRIDLLYRGGGGGEGPWMKLTINDQIIEGECTDHSLDREGTIRCYDFDHDVYVPYDPQTAQPSGPSVHGTISIIKGTDKASPLLYKALCQNETVNEAELWFFRPHPSGAGYERYLTITIQNAKIVEVRSACTNLERVSFIYQDICWSYSSALAGVTGLTYEYHLPGP